MIRIKIIISTIFLAVTFSSICQNKIYSGAYNLNDMPGYAKYEYVEKDNKRIFNGPFHFKYNNYIMIKGHFKNNIKVGKWEFTSMIESGSDRHYKEINGYFKNGNYDSVWNIKSYIRYFGYKKNKLVLLREGEEYRYKANFRDNRFIGKMIINEKGYKNYEINFTNDGYLDGEYIINYKTVEGLSIKKSIKYNNGLLESIKEYDYSNGETEILYNNEKMVRTYINNRILNNKNFVYNDTNYMVLDNYCGYYKENTGDEIEYNYRKRDNIAAKNEVVLNSNCNENYPSGYYMNINQLRTNVPYCMYKFVLKEIEVDDNQKRIVDTIFSIMKLYNEIKTKTNYNTSELDEIDMNTQDSYNDDEYRKVESTTFLNQNLGTDDNFGLSAFYSNFLTSGSVDSILYPIRNIVIDYERMWANGIYNMAKKARLFEIKRLEEIKTENEKKLREEKERKIKEELIIQKKEQEEVKLRKKKDDELRLQKLEKIVKDNNFEINKIFGVLEEDDNIYPSKNKNLFIPYYYVYLYFVPYLKDEDKVNQLILIQENIKYFSSVKNKIIRKKLKAVDKKDKSAMINDYIKILKDKSNNEEND